MNETMTVSWHSVLSLWNVVSTLMCPNGIHHAALGCVMNSIGTH